MNNWILCVLVLLAIACVHADTDVKYVHLALTGDPTQMMVAWYTEDETPTSEVKFGTKSGVYSMNASGTYNFWKKDYGYNHFVLLQNLTTSTKYYYICGSEDWSSENSFTTAPDEFVPFSVGVYGDMGIDNSANTVKRVTDRVANGEMDFIYHVGDLAYADDHVFSFQKTWNTFSENIEAISSSIPYMVMPGNHEYTSYDPFLYFETKNFVVYNHRFSMPKTGTNQSQSMYYSFDYSNVHFISYSTETSYKDAPFGDASNYGDELAWLEADLIEANLPENRQKHPWIIVGGHRPIYSSCEGYSAAGVPINSWSPPSNSLTLQQVFEDLFNKYKVDLILNGHVHSYERNYPTYKNKRTSGYVNPTSPMNIVIGNAGNIEGLENGGEAYWTQPQPQWSAFRYGDDYGYAVMTFHNNTHLSWKFYTATKDELQDEFTLVNMHH